MGIWILRIFLLFLSPFLTLGHEVLNMCYETETSRSPVLHQTPSTSSNSSTSSSSICSCHITSTEDFYILLKKLQVEKWCEANGMVSLTIDGNTSLEDLVEMDNDHGGNDCLLGVGSRDFIPIECRTEAPLNEDDEVVLQTLDNLMLDEHIYLQVMSKGNATINCSRIAIIDSYFYEELFKKNLTGYENGTRGDNKTYICDEDSHIKAMEMNEYELNETGSNNTNTTNALDSSNKQLDEYRKESERMMTASLVMLPIAGAVFIVSILLLARACRREQRIPRVHSKRVSGSTRRAPARENQSYYEEVDEEFHIRMSSTAEVTDHGTAYDLATGPGPMPNNDYSEANHLKAPAMSTTDDGDYNIAVHGQFKNLSPNVIDSTYDVANQSLVEDLDESEAERICSPEVSTASCTVHINVLEETPLSQSSPDQGDSLYSLERIVSPGEKPDVDENTKEDVHPEDESEMRQEDTSDLGDILDAELYANFSSLQSETETQTTPKEIEEVDEEEIYMNQDTLMDRTKSPDIQIADEETQLKVPKPKDSGYTNVPAAKVKETLSPRLASTADSEEDIYQNSPVGVGSTASLVSTNSGSEEHYESYSTKEDPALAIGLDASKKITSVEVVLLKTQAENMEGKKNYGHKQSMSVDESSITRRRTGSKRRRPRSDNTLLLDTSTSEDEPLVMVNNLLYEGTNMASPKKKNCNHPEPQESSHDYDDPDLGTILDDDDDDDDDDDLSIMVQNELYEAFNPGGISLLPKEVSKEMEETLAKKNLTNPVNDSANILCEKM